jgi:putative sporulation protein YtaF
VGKDDPVAGFDHLHRFFGGGYFTLIIEIPTFHFSSTVSVEGSYGSASADIPRIGGAPEMAGLLGGSIIIAAGIWVIFQEKVLHRGKEPQEEKQLVAETGLSRFGFRQIVSILNNPIIADWDFSGHIDLKEATALALALTINNIPNGVGAGMLGLSPLLTTLSVFFFSIITIWIGISSGLFGFHRLGKSTGVISGLILIFVGVYEIFF